MADGWGDWIGAQAHGAWDVITDTVKGASDEAQDWLAQGVNAQTDVIDSVSGLATGYVGAVGGAVSGVVDSSGAAVEKAGSSPGRPGGQSAHSASSRFRTARPAILRQKLISLLRRDTLGPAP